MPSYNKFCQFLAQNSCQKQFEHAYCTQNNFTQFDENIWNIIDFQEYVFGKAFDWNLTAQGRSFWAKIDGLWMDELEISRRKHV